MKKHLSPLTVECKRFRTKQTAKTETFHLPYEKINAPALYFRL